uniref:Zinc transporter ZIP9 n=1 Tax=Hippocampus comes TaxID=109280 RepID=A0A3Q2ZBB4_HIPCM
MDGGLSITLISVVMFVGSFLLGFIPLLFRLSERSLHLVSILGAGFLCGTALAITVPEGVGLMQESWTHQNASLSAGNDSSRESASSPQPWIGVALTSGFTFMFVVDQLASYFSVCADGFALGAVVATGQVTVQVIVFLAVILHKAPAAFGLVAFLIHAGLEKRSIQGHLLAFSAAAPLVAIPTYFILHMTSSSPQNQLGATGVGMLFSGGTFLFVATVHVLPDIISSSSGSRAGQQSGHPKHQSHLGLKESVALVFGIALPVLLALGLHDD